MSGANAFGPYGTNASVYKLPVKPMVMHLTSIHSLMLIDYCGFYFGEGIMVMATTVAKGNPLKNG